MMRRVYGWDIEPTRAFEEATVDHLFGRIWADGDLPVRDRRLVLVGLAVGSGQLDVASLQLDAAIRLGELDADDLRELVVFLAHYAGWPRAAALNSEVEDLLARHQRPADRPGASEAGDADSASGTAPGPGSAARP